LPYDTLLMMAILRYAVYVVISYERDMERHLAPPIAGHIVLRRHTLQEILDINIYKSAMLIMLRYYMVIILYLL